MRYTSIESASMPSMAPNKTRVALARLRNRSNMDKNSYKLMVGTTTIIPRPWRTHSCCRVERPLSLARRNHQPNLPVRNLLRQRILQRLHARRPMLRNRRFNLRPSLLADPPRIELHPPALYQLGYQIDHRRHPPLPNPRNLFKTAPLGKQPDSLLRGRRLGLLPPDRARTVPEILQRAQNRIAQRRGFLLADARNAQQFRLSPRLLQAQVFERAVMQHQKRGHFVAYRHAPAPFAQKFE